MTIRQRFNGRYDFVLRPNALARDLREVWSETQGPRGGGQSYLFRVADQLVWRHGDVLHEIDERLDRAATWRACVVPELSMIYHGAGPEILMTDRENDLSQRP